MNSSTATAQPAPTTIDEWARFLCEREMPIFSNTANNIYALLDDKKKGAMELASIILQDPNLTAKLLKLSNSSYYNPSRQKINTISRAIVILGAQTIRELTLACAFFESILSSANKERANQEIGNAIHAAVQAKELAILTNDLSPEEIFISTLLHNIGNIAFWCFDHKQGKQIHELLNSGRYTAEEAEKKILGFSLRQLSKRLSHSWHLGGLTERAINESDAKDPRLQLIRLGHDICQAIKAGQQSALMQQCQRKLNRLTGLGANQLTERLQRSTAAAVKIAIQFGAHDASRYIDNAPVETQAVQTGSENDVDHKQVQFEILQEISNHISGDINLNILFEMVLEGIHRGIDMDRTMFLLLSADKRSLKEKFSFGLHRQTDDDKIQIDGNGEPNLLFQCIGSAESMWAKPRQHAALYSRQISALIGDSECFVIPLQTENKVIGVICCDRGIRRLPLTQDDYNVCKHFAKQANIGLTLYRMRSH